MGDSQAKPDMRPAIAGDVETFASLEELEALIRAEHPPSAFQEAGVLQPPDSLTPDGSGAHIMLNPELMDGGLEIYRLLPGLTLSVLEFVAKDLEQVHAIGAQAMPQEQLLNIRLFHEGSMVYRYGDIEIDTGVSPGVVSYKPDVGRFSYEMRAGQRYRITILGITEQGEREVWHRFGIPPLPLLQEIRYGEATEERAFELPHSQVFHQFTQSLDEIPVSGPMRTALLRMKVGELFCLLASLKPHSETVGNVPMREVRKLNRARGIIEELDGNAPSISELSAQVGLNRRKLTEGFKQVFGETVAGYALELRMRKGYQLLKESPLAVHKIAEECGYEHPSNFTIAFRRRFGSSPSRIRSQK